MLKICTAAVIESVVNEAQICWTTTSSLMTKDKDLPNSILPPTGGELFHSHIPDDVSAMTSTKDKKASHEKIPDLESGPAGRREAVWQFIKQFLNGLAAGKLGHELKQIFRPLSPRLLLNSDKPILIRCQISCLLSFLSY